MLNNPANSGSETAVPGKSSSPESSPSSNAPFTPPSISLPKGGGAIRGMGEKFAANPVTGTGSVAIPIATSPGRSGFGPQLSLAYDSGAGNGPFGFGWSLSLPFISRKTDKGLPQYFDATESDVFLLSGAEDLVPVYRQKANSEWERDAQGKHVIHEEEQNGYFIRRYRPRIEGLFARIERWTNVADPSDVHWRSISKDNILTLYGKDENSRIADDPLRPTRIFSWLICETRDDRGNAILYEYKAEDGLNLDLTHSHEANRGDVNDKRRQTNRYIKHIYYGNRTPLLDATGQRGAFLIPPQIADAGWMFQVVFDYGEDNVFNETKNVDGQTFVEASITSTQDWTRRLDPFSSYRAGFEVRTCRLCRRVLMFHHFEQELGIADCLVRTTELNYAESPIASFITTVIQSGYVRQPDQAQQNRYLKKSLPPVEFEYSQVPGSGDFAQLPIRDVETESLENLPVGLDGSVYQWVDLDSEGTSGILTEQADGWFYKRNLSANNLVRENGSIHAVAKFGAAESVDSKPAIGLTNGAQFLDLAGKGQVDLVQMDGPVRGFYERTDQDGWEPLQSFKSWPNLNSRDPNLKFVDLTGDGHADILITEGEVLTWYPSLVEDGFGPSVRVSLPPNEERGPHLVFADGTQSIYLADLSGDGLSDLARIRNGEVCYWPNLGYGRFGDKVTMDNAPWFDTFDQFDQQRIRLADTDGSGTTDILYLHREGVCIYANQSGNKWSDPVVLPQFPLIDNVATIHTLDLLGNGTACLVWSSPLPGNAHRPMRYIALMEQKPHLMIGMKNNLGAETKVHYAPSTKFYLQDKCDGKPWITRLPFPVHVVERVETYDHISRNRFVTRSAYHHGYFDGVEREFRGFGRVDRWDTEELAALTHDGTLPTATNVDATSHMPAVLTKTWFHTGVYLGRDQVSDFFAGLLDAQDNGEYYREPGLSDQEAVNLGLDDDARRLYDDAHAKDRLLDDTVLPGDLTIEEEREACRALKGSMLRQEVYALDGTAKEKHPYTVVEQNFSVRLEQPRGGNRHAVFFSHSRETITHHYERNPADPRVQHDLTLTVDQFGNILNSIAIGYGRREMIRVADGQGEITEAPNPDLNRLDLRDQGKQTTTLVAYTENRVTNAINTASQYRSPLPAETRTYELTGFKPAESAKRFSLAEWAKDDFASLKLADEIKYEETADLTKKQKRLIEHVRTFYRKQDLTDLLPLGTVESLALPGESYKLAFTPGLLNQIYVRNGQGLLPANPADVLEGGGADRGGYVDLDHNGHWWIPSGRSFFSTDPADNATAELIEAQQHFFLPRRYRDPFGNDTTVSYAYDLLMIETRDALGNRITVEANDYRVLQPSRVSDPNRNQTMVAFDALGMVVGTAVLGKVTENIGDLLDETFNADLNEATILAHIADPLVDPHALLQKATTRLVYDLFAYWRTRDNPQPQPTAVYALARETHHFDLELNTQTKIQHNFSYSDGFGREIQKKIQAEPGPVPMRDDTGKIIVGADGQPQMTPNDVSPRWVGSSWTIFNNKGKPVRQYEPFFTADHHFEFGIQVGVSPIIFYDPLERVVATLHPNHTYEKIVFDPWQQVTWDVNDTIKPPGDHSEPSPDPRNDPDVGHYFGRLPHDEYLPTWYDLRTDSAKALLAWPDTDMQGQSLPDNASRRVAEQQAAAKAAAHANTPTTAHFDTLGRTFLTLADNGPDAAQPDQHLLFATRVELDLESNQREVTDANDRIVMRATYDMLGNRIYQISMEAGARWTLNDAAGKLIRAFDSRGHSFRTEYDPLGRPLRLFVAGTDSTNPNQELLTERLIYGEQHPQAELRNLRGKPFLHLDQAGVISNEAHDFKGNPLRVSRRIAVEYKQTLNWNTVDALLPANAATQLDLTAFETAVAPWLEADTYTGHTTYNALNFPLTATAPDGSVYRPTFNDANLLIQVDVNLRGTAVATPFVTNIDYDAKGQRQRIDYGNGTSTFYNYDPLTFRLVHLHTRRNALAFPDDSPQPPRAGWPGSQVQNLHYTYDPVGNITHIRDDAQQIIYFRNKRVEPTAEYTYDAIYRLIEASGREHLGQVGGAPIPHSHNDDPRVGINWSANDGSAMGMYTERYTYDAVGNFIQMQHHGSDPVHPGWTRSYTYDETSLIEDDSMGSLHKISNRLSSTMIGNNNSIIERYTYDAHGNMTRMPHLGGTHPDPNMHWDYRDQLCQTDLGGGGKAYYVYDAGGQRVRKVWEKSANLVEERIYLGGFEIYRRRQGAERLERETLHIMDDQQRIALVETRTLDTAGDDPAPLQLIRYQFSNHLGSANLELDDAAQIISYEEYTPYGSTSYQAVRSQAETPKRYRYTGKEHDDESGFGYHGARYYTPWLGRWTATDPIGLVDGPNLYSYVQNNPVTLVDPTGQQSEPETGYPLPDELVKYETDPSEEAGRRLQDYFNSQVLSDEFGLYTAWVDPKWVKHDDGTAHWHMVEYRIEQGVTTVTAEAYKIDKPSLGVSLIPVWGSAQDSAAEFERGNWGWGIFYGAMAVTDVFLIKSLITGGAKLLGKSAASTASKEAIVHAEESVLRGLFRWGPDADKTFAEAQVIRDGVNRMSKATGLELIKLKPGKSLEGALARFDKITLSGHGRHVDEIEGASRIAFGKFGSVTPKELAEILKKAGFKGDIRLASCRTGMNVSSHYMSTLGAKTFAEALKIESGLNIIVSGPIYDIVYGLANMPQVIDAASLTIPKALLPLGDGWLHW